MSEGGGILCDLAAVPNTRHDSRGYDIRPELHATRASTTTPLTTSPPLPSVEPSGTLPPEVPHTFSINRRADTSRPEAATTSLREHHTLHIEEVRR
ncbi:hypothetical protein ACFWOB_05230 [Streptomyces sp. NPDC058420]|uniref:hypothetical protein n=1 Tax=Streptomyces sp. NPDC058420 TaxID=3346489 RepID=UPI0036596AA8